MERKRLPIQVDLVGNNTVNRVYNLMVLPDLTVAHVLCGLRRKSSLPSHMALFLLCGDTLVTSTELVRTVFAKHNVDGTLYISARTENAFG